MKRVPDNVSLFGAHLHALRTGQNYSVDDFCGAFNKYQSKIRLNRSTVTKFEKGLQEPMASTVVALAEFFHVSLGYLLGMTEDRTHKEITITNSTIVQGNSATTLIVHNTGQKSGAQKYEMSEEEAELFRIYELLNVKARTALLSTAYKLEEKQSKGEI